MTSYFPFFPKVWNFVWACFFWWGGMGVLMGRAKRPQRWPTVSAPSCVPAFPIFLFCPWQQRQDLTVDHRFGELKAHVSLLGPLEKILGHLYSTSS